MRITDFTDERVAEVLRGGALSAEERSFLVADTPSFEECDQSQAQLSELNDADLMRAAYSAWADYASCQ